MHNRSKSFQHETSPHNNTSWGSKNPKFKTNGNASTKINIKNNNLYHTEHLMQNKSHSNHSTPRNIVPTPNSHNNISSNSNCMKVSTQVNRDKDHFKPYNHYNIYNETGNNYVKNGKKSEQKPLLNHTSYGKESKYLNIAQFRKKNKLNIQDEDQQENNIMKTNFDGNVSVLDNRNQLELSLTQINKISPYACMCFNIGRAIDMNNEQGKKQLKNNAKRSINDQYKKQEIKEKIKHRVKAQIQNLIKRNTFKLKKIGNTNQMNIHQTNTYTYKFTQPNCKQVLPSENVTIIGQSLTKPFDNLNFYTKQRQKIGQSSFDDEYQNSRLKNIRKSILLGQLGFMSRKVQSSLDYRLTTKQIQKQKYKNRNQDYRVQVTFKQNEKERQNLFTPVQSYRRTMSTDIRIKNMSNIKAHESELRNFHSKLKEDGLQPWIVQSFVDQQVSF